MRPPLRSLRPTRLISVVVDALRERIRASRVRLDVMEMGYPEWQFRRHSTLHLVLSGVALLDAMVVHGAMTSTPLLIFMVTLPFAARLIVALLPASQLSHRAFMALIVLIQIIVAGSDVSKVITSGSTLTMSQWSNWMSASAPIMVGTSILAGTIGGWRPAFAIALTSTLVRFMFVTVNAPAQLQGTLKQTTTAVVSVWFMSFVLFLFLDARGRAQYQDERKLRVAAAAKGRYVAAIAHDFGTPIAVMQILFSQIEDDAVLRERFGETALNGFRVALDMLTTTRQRAISLNQLERGQQLQPQRASCSLKKLAEDISVMAHHMPHPRGVRFELDVASTLLAQDMIITDRGWLQLIAINLLSNAFKNTREGLVRLELHVGDPRGEGAGTMIMRVSDTGSGVPEELVPHLFSAYQQASKWRFGTGLGLFHVKELANALGGQAMFAPSAVSSGATFWVEVPLVLVGSGDPEARADLAPSPATHDHGHTLTPSNDDGEAAGPSEGHGDAPKCVSVLVVDDDLFLQTATATIVQACGVPHVQVASDGQEALSMLVNPENAFDLALIDLQMPIMDGFECVRRLREHERQRKQSSDVAARARKRVRTVAVSANVDDPGVQAEAYSAGFDKTAPKPLKMASIQKLLLDV